MPTYLFSYRTPNRPLDEVLAELDEAGRAARIAAWNTWFDSMGESVLKRGNPVVDARALGNCGPGTRVGGYTFITADDLDAAVALAEGCPGVEWGGGVEVGVIREVTAAESIDSQQGQPLAQ